MLGDARPLSRSRDVLDAPVSAWRGDTMRIMDAAKLDVDKDILDAALEAVGAAVRVRGCYDHALEQWLEHEVKAALDAAVPTLATGISNSELAGVLPELLEAAIDEAKKALVQDLRESRRQELDQTVLGAALMGVGQALITAFE